MVLVLFSLMGSRVLSSRFVVAKFLGPNGIPALYCFRPVCASRPPLLHELIDSLSSHIHIYSVRVGRDVNRQFSFSMAFRFPFNGARFSHAETKLVYISAFYGRLILCVGIALMFFYGFSDFPFHFFPP